jgi:hypothetical protein
MKHLKKWNKVTESTELPIDQFIKNQQDVILDIFVDEIDNNLFEFNTDEERYMSLTCYLDTIDDFDKLETLENNIKKFKKRAEILENLKVNIKRLESRNFNWSVEFDDDYLNFIVFYNKKEYTLSDAFGGEKRMSYIDNSVMKKVMKEKYGLNFTSHRYDPPTSGYYGKNAKFLLYFEGSITDEKFKELQQDLSKLKKIEGSIKVTPFYEYNIELIRWDNYPQFGIKIKING